MRYSRAILLLVALLIVAAALYAAAAVHRGFGTETAPSTVEVWVARLMRRASIPALARAQKNPWLNDARALEAGRAEFLSQCAVCHGVDGTGRTQLGANLYPRVPNVRSAASQALTDGEIHYIIEHGVRLTGMPGWASAHRQAGDAGWRLVLLIRSFGFRGPAPQTLASSAPAPSAHFVGSVSCENCHQDIYRRWKKTPMANIVRDPKEHPEAIIPDLATNPLAKFRKKDRQTDVLLIDDIQFLAGKERIQEEFFHTFNALHESHKQIVLTCDRPASEIQGLEHRLVSRFEWGLVTDLQPPDVEMRLAILQKKAKIMGVELPAEIINFLATRIRTNIRRLEGALIRVASFASLTGKKLTLEVVEGLLREILHEEGRQVISIEVIQKKVAEHFDIRLADMTSKRRPENIAFPRQIAMYLSRQMTESSLNTIGEAFGGRDHGTVLHACRLVKDRMEVDANVRQVVSYLEKQLTR